MYLKNLMNRRLQKHPISHLNRLSRMYPRNPMCLKYLKCLMNL
jgi:hypothetical protein